MPSILGLAAWGFIVGFSAGIYPDNEGITSCDDTFFLRILSDNTSLVFVDLHCPSRRDMMKIVLTCIRGFSHV